MARHVDARVLVAAGQRRLVRGRARAEARARVRGGVRATTLAGQRDSGTIDSPLAEPTTDSGKKGQVGVSPNPNPDPNPNPTRTRSLTHHR